MTEATPDSLIPYDEIVQEALRAVVGRVLGQIERTGGTLPGNHHFYITFKTGAPGVVVPPHLRERFPDEMTIVLQNKFWDLSVGETLFQVSLSFNQIPAKLTVPYSAITAFVDPAVDFGLQFQALAGGTAPEPHENAENDSPEQDQGPRPPVRPVARSGGVSMTKRADKVGGQAKAVAKAARQVADKVPPASPNPMTNLILTDLLLRTGGQLLRRTVEGALLQAKYDKKHAKKLIKGRSMKQTLVATAIARVATRSVPGAILVGGGTLAKMLYDRAKDSRKAQKQGQEDVAEQMAEGSGK
jgi:hypothetical protein